MILHSILLMGAPQPGQSPIMQFLPFILIMVVFYFFMIRPQMKKAKDQKKFREALKKGDRVITIGGIHGRIMDVQDTTFIIEVESGTRLKIEKTAVSMENTGAVTEPLKQ